MRTTTQTDGPEAAFALDMDDVLEMAGRTPLQALASAYAARLAAIRAHADALELADIGEQIAVLERICLRDGGRRPFGSTDQH
ncbi:MAG TPA: hypothetical protein VKB14_02870 [Actinomycetales bacterium]|nr:hypothetical protein [Actinomycetales bacterium]